MINNFINTVLHDAYLHLRRHHFVLRRPEMVVGWYHSHPGFGCWLSGVDINTQQSFEALSERAVAVVVDPIQSVKGKVSNKTCFFLVSSASLGQ